MDSYALSLVEFIAQVPLWGEWEISYTDGTHLPKNVYVKLGDLAVDASQETAHKYPILPFEFQPANETNIRDNFAEIANCHFPTDDKNKKSGQENAIEKAPRLVREQLGESMMRVGLLCPEFFLMEEQTIRRGFFEVMKELADKTYLTFVVDTGALRRATTTFLHKGLPNIPIWAVVPVFVMNEVQLQVENLKNLWGNTGRGSQPDLSRYEVLNKRPQVSCTSQELNRIRMWRPVEMLTNLREHLGRTSGQSRVDRLIIESTKNLKRDRGLYQGVYLLTGDKDLASLATLENQASLHVDVPPLPSKIDSVRYDSYSNMFVLAPVHCLLWDLALVFSKIRLENKQACAVYELNYYSQARGGFIAHDVMEIRKL